MAAVKKTYFLAPTWDYPVNGPIALGNIVADPRNPSETLLSSSDNIPTTFTSSKSAVEVLRGRHEKTRVGVWTQFLDVTWGNGFGTTYTVENLDTNFFDLNLTADDAAYVSRRVGDERVSTVMNVGRRGKSVYMITGIKIARGFAVRSEIVKSRGIIGKLAVSGSAAGAPEGESSSKSTKSDTFSASTDIVFAFRVREIFQKSAKGQTTIGHREHNKGAFLGIEDEKPGSRVKSEIGIGESDATVEDLSDDEEDMKSVLVEDDGESCRCLFF
jgi:hypothetical protein